jgi:outer membrane cobalamin receptor
LSIIAGFAFEKERLAEGFSISYSGFPEIKPATPAKPDMLNNNLASIYLQTEYKFVKSTELTLGLRHDNSSYYGKVNTPRIGLVYNKDKFTTKLLYTEAFRAPKPWDYTYEEGNPDLEPETMRSLEIALAYAYAENFVASLSVYKNTMKGTFTREERRQTNGPDVKTDGFEVALEYKWGKIRCYFNYTYNLSIYENGEKIPEIGNNNANVGMLYAFAKRIKLDVRGHYLGRRKNVKTITATGSDYVDNAVVFNAAFSVLNIKCFDFQLICKNLLDTEYYHPSNNPPERYRQPQRTFLIKAGYKF